MQTNRNSKLQFFKSNSSFHQRAEWLEQCKKRRMRWQKSEPQSSQSYSQLISLKHFDLSMKCEKTWSDIKQNCSSLPMTVHYERSDTHCDSIIIGVSVMDDIFEKLLEDGHLYLAGELKPETKTIAVEWRRKKEVSYLRWFQYSSSSSYLTSENLTCAAGDSLHSSVCGCTVLVTVFSSLFSSSTHECADGFQAGFFTCRSVRQSSATSHRQHTCQVTVRGLSTSDWLGDSSVQTCIVKFLHPLIKQHIIHANMQPCRKQWQLT